MSNHCLAELVLAQHPVPVQKTKKKESIGDAGAVPTTRGDQGRYVHMYRAARKRGMRRPERWRVHAARLGPLQEIDDFYSIILQLNTILLVGYSRVRS